MPERASFDGSTELAEVKLRMLAPAPDVENEKTLAPPERVWQEAWTRV
jgi:hypothetical protein